VAVYVCPEPMSHLLTEPPAALQSRVFRALQPKLYAGAGVCTYNQKGELKLYIHSLVAGRTS
jgi:hypothetical protein